MTADRQRAIITAMSATKQQLKDKPELAQQYERLLASASPDELRAAGYAWTQDQLG